MHYCNGVYNVIDLSRAGDFDFNCVFSRTTPIKHFDLRNNYLHENLCGVNFYVLLFVGQSTYSEQQAFIKWDYFHLLALFMLIQRKRPNCSPLSIAVEYLAVWLFSVLCAYHCDTKQFIGLSIPVTLRYFKRVHASLT